MYRPGERLFAFRLRRTAGRDVLEGASRRYTATALIGLAGEPESTVSAILSGHDPRDVCCRLIDGVGQSEDLGEVALTLWAARALDHPDVSTAVDRLKEMDPAHHRSCPTVEFSWALTALTADGCAETTRHWPKRSPGDCSAHSGRLRGSSRTGRWGHGRHFFDRT